MRKSLIFILSSLIALLMLAACQLDDAKEYPVKDSDKLIIETGINDSEYQGVVNPQLEIKFKMTEEEERNGIKKLDMEGEEVDIDQLNKEEGDDGDGGNRPNI